MKEFKRYRWEEYEKMLIAYNYSPEQISAVKEIRENPKAELMTPEQFRYLFMAGIIKRVAKLKKSRSLYVIGDDIVFLNHYHKQFEKAGFFINEEN